ncbi:hypothetical protein ACEPT7_03510 [Burkholderia ubonensis]|uniref:hypothetical protein n=1 Tax=Burkholderia ubonensis TaxID=101571 RepID=UPI00358E375F
MMTLKHDALRPAARRLQSALTRRNIRFLDGAGASDIPDRNVEFLSQALEQFGERITRLVKGRAG